MKIAESSPLAVRLSARCVRLSMFLLAPFASAIEVPQGTALDGRAVSVLWYQKPAAKWGDAMPLGNGRLGAMVFGGAAEERVQLNESTLWGGSPCDYSNPEAGQHLPELRRLIFAGRISEAQELADKMLGNPYCQKPYQPLGALSLRFPHYEHVENYARSLDLDRAIATTTYQVNGIHYEREIFVSVPDQVMVMHLSASKPGAIIMELGLNTSHSGVRAAVTGRNTLRMAGRIPPRSGQENWSSGWEKPGMKFEARVLVRTDGGTIEGAGDHLKVSDADSVTLLWCAATGFKNYQDAGGEPEEAVEMAMSGASAKTFVELRARHLADYQPLFRRVALDFGTSPAAALPTDQRIAGFAKEKDPALVALYYQFGRYLLLASSRSGGQPANLQGIWNQELWPAWSSKWTTNINAEMNYWAAETANLSECHEPLFDLIDDLRVAGQKTAREWYGCRGFVVHHNQEWIGDWDGAAPDQGHRHLSHLYATMPGQSITPRQTPRYAAAVRKSLERRGDGGMGWSKAWKVGLWARLGEGDRALSMVEGLIKGSTLPSMLDNGPPFQIDGNFGGCAGIGEMLLQSRAAGEATLDDAGGRIRGGSGGEAIINLLPALPEAWRTGSLRGLRARGGFEVDCTWREGRLIGATIRSKHGASCQVRYRDKMITLETKKGQSIHLDGELKC